MYKIWGETHESSHKNKTVLIFTSFTGIVQSLPWAKQHVIMHLKGCILLCAYKRNFIKSDIKRRISFWFLLNDTMANGCVEQPLNTRVLLIGERAHATIYERNSHKLFVWKFPFYQDATVPWGAIGFELTWMGRGSEFWCGSSVTRGGQLWF